MSISNFVIYAVVFIGITLALFLLFRVVNLWYWKIDERINVQEEQKELLSNTVAYLKALTDLKVLEAESAGKSIMVTHKTSGETKKVTVSEWLNSYNNESYVSFFG